MGNAFPFDSGGFLHKEQACNRHPGIVENQQILRRGSTGDRGGARNQLSCAQTLKWQKDTRPGPYAHGKTRQRACTGAQRGQGSEAEEGQLPWESSEIQSRTGWGAHPATPESTSAVLGSRIGHQKGKDLVRVGTFGRGLQGESQEHQKPRFGSVKTGNVDLEAASQTPGPELGVSGETFELMKVRSLKRGPREGSWRKGKRVKSTFSGNNGYRR